MGDQVLLEEIQKLLTERHIDTEDAMRLMLVAQMKIISEMAVVRSELNEVRERQERYPSVLWLWNFRRREVIIVIAVLFFVYTLIFSPWNISDLRHALLEAVGLPHDLGVGP